MDTLLNAVHIRHRAKNQILIFLIRLRSIAPVIKVHGIDYEKGKFREKLNDGSLSLVKTEVSNMVYRSLNVKLPS